MTAIMDLSFPGQRTATALRTHADKRYISVIIIIIIIIIMDNMHSLLPHRSELLHLPGAPTSM